MEEARPPLDPQELLSHREWIRGLARKLVRDEHTAEDVAQDALTTALSRRPPVLRSLRGWLATVTRSRAIDRQRADSTRVTREQGTRPRSVPSTADLVARADAQRAVAAAVMELEEPYRTTVLLRHFEDLTPSEIGERTGVPRETVKTRLRRAHGMLRGKLDDEFGGDRERWRKALLPLIGPLAPPLPDVSPVTEAAASSAAASSTGALVMSAKSKIAVAAAAVLLVLAGTAAVGVLNEDDVADARRERARVAQTPEPRSAREDAEPDTLSAPRSLTGRVRRRSDGAPVPNASVVVPLQDGGDVRVATASDGAFTLDAPAGALERLTVSAGGYAPETVELPHAVDELGTIWIAGGTRLDVTVEDAAGGLVADAQVVALRWRNPGDRAHVDSYLMGMTAWDEDVVEKRRATAGSKGVATFADLRPGLWRVLVDGPDVGTRRSAYVAVHPGATAQHETVVVAPLVALRGRVLTADGDPVAGALVNAEYGAALTGPSRVHTDETGAFALERLSAGTVALSVDACGSGPGTKLAVVQVPDVAEFDVVLPPTGRMQGRVTDGDGNALAGETVRIDIYGSVETVTATTTDADGRYEFSALPVGSVQRFRIFSDVRVQQWPRIEVGELIEAGPNGPTSRKAMIRAGETTTIDAVLVRGGTLTGTVVGPDGPLAGVQVWRHRKPTRAGQNWAGTTTDDHGRYRFPPELPGPVAVQVRHPELYQPGLQADVHSALRKGQVADEFMVEIPAHGEVEMNLHVRRGGSVRGRVEDENGEPVAGARVTFAPMYSEAYGRTIVTGAGGTFVFPHARPGLMRALRATSTDGALVGAARVNVTDEGAREPVVIVAKAQKPSSEQGDVHSVAGRVRRAEGGGAVAGAAVVLLRTPPMMLNGFRLKDRHANAPIVTQTDGEGRFTCEMKGDGPFWLAVETRDTIESVVKVPDDFGDVDVRLRRALTVAGHVRDADGSALAGAMILASCRGTSEGVGTVVHGAPTAGGASPGTPRVAYSRSDGSFVVRGIPEGTCKLTVYRSSEFADGRSAISSKGTAFGPYDAGSAGLDLRFDAPQRAALRLRVSYPDGSPVTAGAVRWSPEGEMGGGFLNVGQRDGLVTIPDAAHPSYVVRVTAYGDQSRTRLFRGLAPGDAEHSLVMERGASITGRVVDARGAPVAGLQLTARPDGAFEVLSSYSAATRGDGTFTLSDLEDRKYGILPSAVAANGRWYRVVEWARVEAPGANVTLRVTSEGSVSGVAVDADGAPVAGTTLYFYRSNGTASWSVVPHVVTDEDGRFEMTGLDPKGAWSVEPRGQGLSVDERRQARIRVSVGDRTTRVVVPTKD